VKQQHTSTATSILTTKSTYRCVSKPFRTHCMSRYVCRYVYLWHVCCMGEFMRARMHYVCVFILSLVIYWRKQVSNTDRWPQQCSIPVTSTTGRPPSIVTVSNARFRDGCRVAQESRQIQPVVSQNARPRMRASPHSDMMWVCYCSGILAWNWDSIQRPVERTPTAVHRHQIMLRISKNAISIKLTYVSENSTLTKRYTKQLNILEESV
jgi:hypothetical protein